MMNLWDLKQNSEGIIVRWLADKIPDRYQRRLGELGFHVDERITCVRQTFAGGPRLYQIGHCVYALEKQIATAIEIRLLT